MGKRIYRKRKPAARRPKRAYKKAKVIYATDKLIYKAKLRCAPIELQLPANASLQYECEPSLSDIQASELAAFTELYDEFKITGVTTEIMPRGNEATLVQSMAGSNHTLGFNYYSVLDNTDVNSITVPEAFEYASVKNHVSWRKMKRYYKSYTPVLTHDLNNNPLINVKPSGWLQLTPQTIGGVTYDNTIIAHIGMKITGEPNLNSYTQKFDMIHTLHVQFRNKK